MRPSSTAFVQDSPRHRYASAPATILVIGLGNDLVGDDGIGPTAMHELGVRDLPRHVRLAGVHADLLGLANAWRGEAHVWLVDAVMARTTPGTVHCVGHEALFRVRQRHSGAHALSLPELLGWLVIGHPPMVTVRFRLWGVEPVSFVPGDALDPRVRDGVAQLVDRLLSAAVATPPCRD